MTDTATRPWTEDEDRTLLYWGRCLNDAFGDAEKGYAHVASMDLGREPSEGPARAAVLKRERPAFVAEIEAADEADQRAFEEAYR